MGTDGPLRLPGCPRRVEDRGVVLGQELDVGGTTAAAGSPTKSGKETMCVTAGGPPGRPGRRGGRGPHRRRRPHAGPAGPPSGADPLEALLVGEDHDAGRVRQAELELVGRPPSVEGDDNGAGEDRTPKGHHPLGKVAHRMATDHPSRRRTRPGGGGRWSRRSGSAPRRWSARPRRPKSRGHCGRGQVEDDAQRGGGVFPGSQRHAVDLDVFHLEHLPRPVRAAVASPMDMVVASSLILGRPPVGWSAPRPARRLGRLHVGSRPTRPRSL